VPAIQACAISGAQIPLSSALRPGLAHNPILRRRQRPFRAVRGDGPYQLPKAISDRLETAMGDFRNAEAAFALALFLGRFWSAPNRLEMPFPIDRRALTNHQALGLSEGEIRGAIRTLERVGFLDRPIPEKASRYRATAEGLHRKPILFAFGEDFSAAFRTANQMAQRKSRQGFAPISREHLHRKSVGIPNPPLADFSSPKRSLSPKRSIFMGELSVRNGEEKTALEKSLVKLATALGLPLPDKAVCGGGFQGD
jgi:hypothetical protein